MVRIKHNGKLVTLKPKIDRALTLERNIFRHLEDFTAPETAYVVGPGPHGAAWHSHLRAEFTTIALNSMVTKALPWTYWMVYDPASLNYDWFTQGSPAGCINIMGDKVADERAHYTFNGAKHMRYANRVVDDHCLLNGATVAGVACQFLRIIGCKRIILVGCDFYGNTHYDGSLARRGPKEWPQLAYMNRLILRLQRDGIDVRSLSQTMLNVPRIGI